MCYPEEPLDSLDARRWGFEDISSPFSSMTPDSTCHTPAPITRCNMMDEAHDTPGWYFYPSDLSGGNFVECEAQTHSLPRSKDHIYIYIRLDMHK